MFSTKILNFHILNKVEMIFEQVFYISTTKLNFRPIMEIITNTNFVSK